MVIRLIAIVTDKKRLPSMRGSAIVKPGLDYMKFYIARHALRIPGSDPMH
jgi:hypothetical protein